MPPCRWQVPAWASASCPHSSSRTPPSPGRPAARGSRRPRDSPLPAPRRRGQRRSEGVRGGCAGLGWGRARQGRASEPLGALPSPHVLPIRPTPQNAAHSESTYAGLGNHGRKRRKGRHERLRHPEQDRPAHQGAARRARGEQEEFANLIGMSRSYFGEVETGKRNVAAVNLEKDGAKGLGVSLAEFFDSEFFGER